jgi:hypothetical protein
MAGIKIGYSHLTAEAWFFFIPFVLIASPDKHFGRFRSGDVRTLREAFLVGTPAPVFTPPNYHVA